MTGDNLAVSPIGLLRQLLDGRVWHHDGYRVAIVEDTAGLHRVCILADEVYPTKPMEPVAEGKTHYLPYEITLEQFLNAAPNLFKDAKLARTKEEAKCR